MSKKGSAEKTIRNIRCKIRRLYSSEEKIRIVLEGLRGEESIGSMGGKMSARRVMRRSKEKFETIRQRQRN